MDIANKPVCNIDNWMHLGDRLFGTVSNHPRQKEFKDPVQITSRVIQINKEQNFAITENSVYLLGKEQKHL